MHSIERRLSENSVLQTSVDIEGWDASRLIDCLSANTRVKELYLNLACSIDGEGKFQALVDWLNRRGEKCGLILALSRRWRSDVVDLQTLESRAAILSSSATNLNVSKLVIHNLDEETLSDALMKNIFSLTTAETRVELSDLSFAATRRRLLPHIQRIGVISFVALGTHESVSTDFRELFESILSQRNIRKFELMISSTQLVDHVVDCLNRQGQDGATLDDLTLRLNVDVRIGLSFVTSLQRFPSRFSVAMTLFCRFDCGFEDTDVALSQSLVSVPSLTSLELRDINAGNLSRWVNKIEGLCHGRLHKFELDAKIADARCLTRSLQSSDLQVLHLNLSQSTNELVNVAHTLANVLPTMTRIRDFRVWQDGDEFHPLFAEQIKNEQHHNKYLTSTLCRHRPTYIAYDALYTAVCDHSPSITTCFLPEFTEWHRDRLAFALKTRVICVEKFLSSNETPVSLLPPALSLLSEGHWYDVMAYIVREKADLLKAPTAVERDMTRVSKRPRFETTS